MEQYSLERKFDRFLQLSEEMRRVAGSLAELSIASTAVDDTDLDGPAVSEEAVRWFIRVRRERARYLSADLFAEPAWDMLLDLLHAEIAQQRVSISSLCGASGVPATTALRYMKAMTERGILIRRPDPHDGRRIYVELAPEASKALRRYFVDVVQDRQAA